MNRSLLLPIGMGALLAAASACSPSQAQVRTPAEARTVGVARVARGDVAQVLTIAAEFRPFQEIDVHAKVAGYLKAITVDVGDRVKAGQLLAVLEIPELQDELQQDEASAKRAEQEVNRARADLERAQSAHQIAHLGTERLLAVSKARPKLIAQQDIDDASGRDRMAEAQVSTAKASLAAAEEQLAAAKASQNKTRTLFGYARITAPFDGVVTHRYADTGAMIQAGTSSQTQTMPIVKLSENKLLRLVIPVPESAVPRIHEKEPVDVHVQALGRTFPGTIARFSDRLDPDTRTMHVEVDVPNRDLQLVPGMYAEASIALDQANDVLIAPVQAIDRGEGRHGRVLVVGPNDTVQPRDVTLGLETADRVQIASGLSEGDLVVVGNRAQLKAGTKVSPKILEPALAEGTR